MTRTSERPWLLRFPPRYACLLSLVRACQDLFGYGQLHERAGTG